MSGCNKKNLIGPILFSYYEESLVSSNLNSKQLKFHGAHPNLPTYLFAISFQNLLKTANLFFVFYFDETLKLIYHL